MTKGNVGDLIQLLDIIFPLSFNANQHLLLLYELVVRFAPSHEVTYLLEFLSLTWEITSPLKKKGDRARARFHSFQFTELSSTYVCIFRPPPDLRKNRNCSGCLFIF